MAKIKILWADDEIHLLKPHIIFLEEKGYDVSTTTSGAEALEMVDDNRYDLVFLDENMPGISGLEVLSRIKSTHSSLPVVMITKSEEEFIMEEAIGSKISDYLIKPVNPKQILLTIKKNLDTSRLVSEKTTINYQQEFRNIGTSMHNRMTFEEWQEVYKRLVYWELELDRIEETGLNEILQMQKDEASHLFSRFIEDNYIDWLHGREEAPLMSPSVIKEKVIPHINDDSTTFLIVVDNLRYDQWEILKPKIREYFWIDDEDTYLSILPTTTQYARNSLFAGLMPSEIEKMYPKLWLNDEEEGGKNLHEEELLGLNLKRLGKKDMRYNYYKVLNQSFGRKVVDEIPNMMKNKFNTIVYNFIDMLSHARTDTNVIKELAEDEAAYRSLTLSWFEHSSFMEAIKVLASKKAKVILTTDHGSIKVKNPSKVIGDKNVNTNLRYKQGKNLSFDKGDVMLIKEPIDAFLPRVNMSQSYIFAKNDLFFAYPNNYNHYVQYYRDTFQHGGISLEEMMVPIVTLLPKV